MHLLTRAPRDGGGAAVRQPSRWRRLGAVVASTAIAATGLVAFSVSGASAATQTITNATFDWGISAQMQTGTHIGPTTCHFFSAGASPSTSSATYTPSSGNVNVLKDGVAPTWSNKCDGAAAGTVNQKVHWTGGTGTVDPSTGAATITFTGKLWVNFYSGLSPFFIQDPVVTVQSNGDGTVVGTMGGFTADRDNPTAPAIPIADVASVTISDLSGVASNNTTGFVTTPDYAGILITPPAGASPQNTTNAFVGAFPQSFVTFHGNTGLASFWYSSGDSFDPTKAASAIAVAYGTLSGDPDPDPEPPAPGTGEQVISATVPDEVDPGEFIWTIDAVDHSVTLTEAADQGTFLQSTGDLKPIKVTDSRVNGPTWTISGQLGDFTGGLSGTHLGWTPNVSVAGSGANPGGQVLSGFTSGNGLKDTSALASATAGHAVGGTATIGAGLDLRLPKDTAAGTYSATLTITALS